MSGAVQVGAGLGVNDDLVGGGLHETGQQVVRLLHHQVDVQGQAQTNIQGAQTSVKGTAMVEVQGALVKIN